MKQRITIEVDCEPLTKDIAARYCGMAIGILAVSKMISEDGTTKLSIEEIPSDNGGKAPVATTEYWRKPLEEDIVRGTVVRVWDYSTYGHATIIKVRDGYATLARPFAYATNFDSNQPLLGCEVYEVSIKDLVTVDQYQVNVNTNSGNIAKMVI